MSNTVDVVVIGMGPGAKRSQLAEAGLSVVGADARFAGGECPYYGCVPSKMMIRAANGLTEARRVPTLAGHSQVTPDYAPIAARIRAEATGNWDDQVAVDRFTGKGGRFVRGPSGIVSTTDSCEHNPTLRELALGPGMPLRVWGGEVLTKYPQDSGPTALHDDMTFEALDTRISLNVWIALADVPVERGCLTFLSGLHRREEPDWIDLAEEISDPLAGMIRPVVADDHSVVRDGLSAMLATQPTPASSPNSVWTSAPRP